MDYYLFTARSVTHAQRMAQILERAGIYVKIRRNSAGGSGCGYTLQVAARQYRRAVSALRQAGQLPVKVFSVSGGERREEAL